MTINEELKGLVEQFELASDAYYNGDAIMEDAEFDTLRDRIQQIDPNHSVLSITGAAIPEGAKKAKHSIPMRSLDKITTASELLSWMVKATALAGESVDVLYVLLPKFDGFSLSVRYVKGKFVQAVTRGDGEVGEDVTANALRMPNIRKQLKFPFTGSVRGEGMLTVANWAKVDPAKSTNPRNVAAGLMRRGDGQNVELLDFWPYDIVSPDGNMWLTKVEKLQYLESLGFDSIPYKCCGTSEQLLQWIAAAGEDRNDLGYHIDGMVIDVNDLSLYSRMGISSERPNGARAWKWGSETALTVIERVELTVGHTGAITPTAKLRPVQLMGTTVQSVLLCNWDEIKRLEVAVGDTVKVSKRGDTIPKVEEVTHRPEERKSIPEPVECPVCRAAAARATTGLGEIGAATRCLNELCPARIEGRVGRWVNSLEILGIGDEMLASIVDFGCDTPAKLYRLSVTELANLRMNDRMVGMSRAKSVVNEIQNKRSLTLDQFLGSLGLQYLGKRKVQQIRELAGEQLDTIEAWRQAGKLVELKEQCKIPGIATKLERVILAAGATIDDLLTEVKIIAAPIKGEKPAAGTPQFVLTGKFDVPKQEIHDRIALAGFLYGDDLRKGVTTHLVQADPASTSSKSKKAKTWGIAVIGLDQLEEILNAKLTTVS